jgi:hypothetical protein
VSKLSVAEMEGKPANWDEKFVLISNVVTKFFRGRGLTRGVFHRGLGSGFGVQGSGAEGQRDKGTEGQRDRGNGTTGIGKRS